MSFKPLFTVALLGILPACVTGCSYYDPYGRVPAAPTRVDPARLGAPPSLDPRYVRRGPYARPAGPYLGRPYYRY